MLRRLIPALGQTLLSETDDMGLVKRLWEMKMSDGAEVSAILFFDSALGEAVVKLSVHSAHAEDRLAEELADGLRAALEANGAVAMEAADA
jgi:hypothetical protein